MEPADEPSGFEVGEGDVDVVGVVDGVEVDGVVSEGVLAERSGREVFEHDKDPGLVGRSSSGLGLVDHTGIVFLARGSGTGSGVALRRLASLSLVSAAEWKP
jgi:hypothetical protein